MRLKCKIRLLNDSVILVDIETLNFIENPDIASIPETSEDYFQESTVITPSQLEHILHPKALSLLQEEMMSHHTQLHHLPFPQLIVMTESGEIPRHLASLKGCCPICVPCLIGQAHKCPWQFKPKKIHPIWKKSDDHPGARASMDHLVSAQPGLIPRIIGRLTCMQINGALVIIDNYSDHLYVLLMRNLSLEEALLAKHAYECFLSSIGATAKAYHTDNGQFSDKGFKDDCTMSNQSIMFCGVGGHHQNGIAECKIKELTLGARTLLLNAKRMLPEYILTILWLFALKCAEERLNNLAHQADGRTPYQTIASLEASKIKLADFHTLAHHVMYLMLVFSLDLRQFLNGNLRLRWANMMADHHPMFQMFHLF
jgi:hypothetical protein